MLYLGMDETGHAIPSVDEKTKLYTNYYGFAVPVEPWTNFIAVDADGKVHCYDAKPSFYESGKQWMMGIYGHHVRYCGEFALEGVDWRDTLKEVNHFKCQP